MKTNQATDREVYMKKKSKPENEKMDERQIQERWRFGFHSFMISCVELVLILVGSMFYYNDLVNYFYVILLAALIIPILYFNIATKVKGVTNKMECVFSIILAVLYIIMLFVFGFQKSDGEKLGASFKEAFSLVNVIVGLVFVINGVIGLLYMINDKKARNEDYLETHGNKKSSDAEKKGFADAGQVNHINSNTSYEQSGETVQTVWTDPTSGAENNASKDDQGSKSNQDGTGNSGVIL